MADTTICFVCERMIKDRARRDGRSHSLTRPANAPPRWNIVLSSALEECKLCRRPFCAKHKSTEIKGVCEINHATYYWKHPNIMGIFPNMAAFEHAQNQREEREKEEEKKKHDEKKIREVLEKEQKVEKDSEEKNEEQANANLDVTSQKVEDMDTIEEQK